MTMKSKKSGGYSPKYGVSALRPAHEGLEDGEEDAAVLRHLALLADVCRVDAHQRLVVEGRKGVVGLVGQNVAVGQKEDARAARRLTLILSIRQVPAALKQLPRNLEGDEGLAGAGRQRQQDALLPRRNRGQHPLDGDVLVVASLEEAAPVLERHRCKAIPPGAPGGESPVPQFIGRREYVNLAFHGALHVDAVDTLAVAGIGEAQRQLAGVILGLRHALGQRLVPRLGLDHRQLGVAEFQNVVRRQRLAALARALQPTERDRVFAPDAAAIDHAPARRCEGGVDVFGAGFGFVHEL